MVRITVSALVPLPGHTHGHTGVAVRTANGWDLLAGDAYFDHREMHASPQCTPGLRFYQWMMQKDGPLRLQNQARLRELVAQDRDVQVYCSHDPNEFERLSGRALGMPAERMREPRHAFAQGS